MRRQLPILSLFAGVITLTALPSTAQVTTSVFSRYQGTWLLTTARSDVIPRLTRTIRNRCAAAGQFYICEQRSESGPPSVLVFSPTPALAVFRSTVLASDGTFQQTGTVQVSGADWVFPWEEQDSAGARHFFRVINTWVDDGHILYRKEDSRDGRQWRLLESGDEWKDQARSEAAPLAPVAQRPSGHDLARPADRAPNSNRSCP
ncbi:MAG: hypothetical protein ACXWC4_00890 [Telluria sp.]